MTSIFITPGISGKKPVIEQPGVETFQRFFPQDPGKFCTLFSIDSVTIAKLLMQNKRWQDDQGGWHEPTRPLTRGDVIVMDEAGMVGTRDMKSVLEAAQAVGAKVVLMGDRKQLQSVAAGGALRALIEKVGLDSALTSVQRQKNDDIKNVVAHSRTGDIAQSLDLLDRKGGLHLVDDKPAGVTQVIDSWKRHYDHNSARAAETSVMLANTNIDVEKLNGLARAYLKQIGDLKGAGSEIDVSDRDGISLGKKEFLANDRIVFLKNTTFGEGQQKQAVKNGQTGRILAINGTALKIQLDNGKQVVCDITSYNNLSHAYAITTHKSQGITVDHAAILGGGFMQSLNQTYVQLSRVRHDVDFVLPKNDIERLMVAVEPTKKMQALALKIAERKGHDLALLSGLNFLETRNYLNDHADFAINGTPETNKDRWRREIGDLLDRMGQTVEKENTFDYEIAPKQQEERVIEISF
jgi:ATP-dependent exoDNAse (exonuclease V) alpha subunit